MYYVFQIQYNYITKFFTYLYIPKNTFKNKPQIKSRVESLDILFSQISLFMLLFNVLLSL